MLIPSGRHTEADLSQWSALEQSDMLYARVHSRRIQRLTEESENQIRIFLSAGPAVCGVSWGKDSVLLAWMARRIDPSMQFVRFRSPEDKYPHDDDVRDYFLSKWPIRYEEVVVEWPQRGRADWAKREALATARFGTSRRMTGLRAEESASRRVSFAAHGISTDISCRPLGHWMTPDVFAVLATEQLPVHPSYAMTGGGRWDRNRLRVSGLGGSPGEGHGRALWEQEYYGDMLRRLAASKRRSS